MKRILLLILALTLTSCAPQVAVSSEVTVTLTPIVETQPSVEELLAQKVIAQIQADPNYQLIYVQALEEVNGQSIPETCADFVARLSILDEKLVRENSSFSLTTNGDCFIETPDLGLLILNTWDPAGNPLYCTREGASKALGVARISAAAERGFWCEAYDADDQLVGVVNGAAQWSTLEAALQALEAPAVAATPTSVNVPGDEVQPSKPTIDAQAIQRLVEGYLAAPFDLTTLSLDQRAAFSLAYTEKLNASAPIVSYKNNEAYINPDSLEMLQYQDGVSEADKKFETFVAVKEDADGNLFFFDAQSGAYKLIHGSQGMDWTMLVDDQEDTGIVYPTTRTFNDSLTNGQDMTHPQRWLSKTDPEEAKFNRFFTPIIFLDKQVGTIFLDGGYGSPIEFGLMSFGKPLLAGDRVIAIQKFLVKADVEILLYAEGEDWEKVTSGWTFGSGSRVPQSLEEAQVYYLGLKGNQQWLKDANGQAFPNLAFGTEAIHLVQDGTAITSKVGLVEIQILIKKNP